MALRNDDFGHWLVSFDPSRPHPSLFASGFEAMRETQTMVPAVSVPWPPESAPVPQPLSNTPDEYAAPLAPSDVLIVTWTWGEAKTLAQLMTGDNFEDWYQYRHKVKDFIPKVTGPNAPFNDPELTRYYRSLGLYFPLRIGQVKVLAYKSGLHMAYDGPDMPVVDLWTQIIEEVQPKLVITTGTGGGIGANVLLGDVIVSNGARFHLTTRTFAGKPYDQQYFQASTVNSAQIATLATPSLLKPNGDHLQDPRIPQIYYPTDVLATIVTTDEFEFDDSTDHYELQGKGMCCDMGDATLGLAMSQLRGAKPEWIAIRNASDPQISNPNNDFRAAKQQAEDIYGKYQLVTTAGSVIASWATIVSKFAAKAVS